MRFSRKMWFDIKSKLFVSFFQVLQIIAFIKPQIIAFIISIISINLESTIDMFLIIFITVLEVFSDCKLIYGFSFIRHGVLYPKKGFYVNNFSSQLQAELTPIGMRQLYNLGTYIREEYMKKVPLLDINKGHTVQFYSSSLQRTQLSAYCFMYGLYPLYEGPKIRLNSNIKEQHLRPPFTPLFPKNLHTQPKRLLYALHQGLQPYPVHQLDYILDQCRKYNLLAQNRKNQLSNQIENLKDQYFGLIQKMRLLFKMKPSSSNIKNISSLYRELESDQYLGIPMPKDYTQDDNKKLKFIYEYHTILTMQSKFGKTMITLPFQFMRDRLNSAANGNLNRKMTFIMCHSSNMFPLMVHLNLTSSRCIAKSMNNTFKNDQNCGIPQYASSLIVELHQNDDNEDAFFIKIKFNGKYMKMCGGDQYQCPLQEFLQRVKNTEQDYESQCGPKASQGQISNKK